MPTTADRYQRDHSIVSRQIVGETILVPVRQNVGDMDSIYTLNETAATAWELFDGENSLGRIRDQIVIEYEVDPESAWQDLLELVSQLEGIGALEQV